MENPVAWILGLGSLILFVLLIVHLLLALVLIVPTWRICTRAGFSGALSLFHLVPVIGSFIVMAGLAFSGWPDRGTPPAEGGGGGGWGGGGGVRAPLGVFRFSSALSPVGPPPAPL